MISERGEKRRGDERIYVRLKICAKPFFKNWITNWIFNFTIKTLISFLGSSVKSSQHVSTWIAVHGGKVVLVVLVGGQVPGADRGIERMRIGDEVRVSQVGGQVVCGGEGWRVGGRVALWRLGGHHHPAYPCGILQHLRKRNGGEYKRNKNMFLEFQS